MCHGESSIVAVLNILFEFCAEAARCCGQPTKRGYIEEDCAVGYICIHSRGLFAPQLMTEKTKSFVLCF